MLKNDCHSAPYKTCLSRVALYKLKRMLAAQIHGGNVLVYIIIRSRAEHVNAFTHWDAEILQTSTDWLHV